MKRVQSEWSLVDLNSNACKTSSREVFIIQRPNQALNSIHQYVLSYHFIRMIFLLLVATLWSVALIFLAVARITHDDDGMSDYVKHFTYWSLSIQIVFYVLAVLSLLVALVTGHEEFLYGVYVFVFWVAFGVVNLVFWTMPILLYLNPGILLLNMKSFGGQFEDGNVLVVNYLYHYAPIAIMFFYALVSFREIERAYAWAAEYIFPQGKFASSARIVYIVAYVFMPLILFLIYHAIFDYEDIYGVEMSETGAVLVGLFLVGFFQFLLITLVVFYHYPHGDSVLGTKTLEETQVIMKWLKETKLDGTLSFSKSVELKTPPPPHAQ